MAIVSVLFNPRGGNDGYSFEGVGEESLPVAKVYIILGYPASHPELMHDDRFQGRVILKPVRVEGREPGFVRGRIVKFGFALVPEHAAHMVGGASPKNTEKHLTIITARVFMVTVITLKIADFPAAPSGINEANGNAIGIDQPAGQPKAPLPGCTRSKDNVSISRMPFHVSRHRWPGIGPGTERTDKRPLVPIG